MPAFEPVTTKSKITSVHSHQDINSQPKHYACNGWIRKYEESPSISTLLKNWPFQVIVVKPFPFQGHFNQKKHPVNLRSFFPPEIGKVVTFPLDLGVSLDPLGLKTCCYLSATWCRWSWLRIARLEHKMVGSFWVFQATVIACIYTWNLFSLCF